MWEPATQEHVFTTCCAMSHGKAVVQTEQAVSKTQEALCTTAPEQLHGILAAKASTLWQVCHRHPSDICDRGTQNIAGSLRFLLPGKEVLK